MRPQSVLVLVAHPDDAELTCGGTIRRWVDEGTRAHLAVATDGARGGKHEGADGALVSAERRREQDAAARVLGFESTTYLDLPDGDIREQDSLFESLVRLIRHARPDAVMLMDPLTVIFQDSYINHRDHRVLGMAALDAMYPQASNAGYFPEHLEMGLELHKVNEVFLTNTERPNAWVDVSVTLEVRFDALRCHRSQMKLWPDSGEGVMALQRKTAREAGMRHGVTYAEEFRRVIANPLT